MASMRIPSKVDTHDPTFAMVLVVIFVLAAVAATKKGFEKRAFTTLKDHTASVTGWNIAGSF